MKYILFFSSLWIISLYMLKASRAAISAIGYKESKTIAVNEAPLTLLNPFFTFKY